MSFGFGIGDVITAINALVKDCDKISPVQKSILGASKDANQLLGVLTSIGKATTEKTSIAHKNPSVKEQLHLEIENALHDIKKLRGSLHAWIRQEERPPLQRAVHRVLFAYYNIPEFQEIRSNFAKYRNKLDLMLQVLHVTDHNEVQKRLDGVRAKFGNFEERRVHIRSAEDTRMREREERYREWEHLGFGEKTIPGKIKELRNFLEDKQRKLEESTVRGKTVQKHLDDITSRLVDAQTSEPIPLSRRITTVQNSESWPSGASSASSRERRDPATPRRSSRASRSKDHKEPTSRESTSHISRSEASVRSQTIHPRRRDSSRGSESATPNRKSSVFALENPTHQLPSSSSSRPASIADSGRQSSVGTPRPPAVDELSSAVSKLLLEEIEESEGWIVVPDRDRAPRSPVEVASTASRSSHSNNKTRHTPTTLPPPLARGRGNRLSILCVNWENTTFSKIAQTYFELLRLWAMNNSNYWPFDRVESCNVVANKKTDISCDFAMDVLAPPGSYFRSNFRSRDFPNEKERLLTRLEANRPVAFRKEFLNQFQYVLCFDEKSFEAVSKYLSRGQDARSDRRVRCISLELDHLAGRELSMGEAKTAAARIKIVVEVVMEKTLGWKRPDHKLVEGQQRTLQICVHKRMTGAIIGTGGANIRDIEAKSNCKIRIFDEGLEGICSLILARGQVQELKWVEERIRAMVPPGFYWA